MSKDETIVQYIKIALGVVAILCAMAWGNRVIELLQIIASHK